MPILTFCQTSTILNCHQLLNMSSVYYQLSWGKKRKTIILNIYINYKTGFQFQRHFKLWKYRHFYTRMRSSFVTLTSPLRTHPHHSGDNRRLHHHLDIYTCYCISLQTQTLCKDLGPTICPHNCMKTSSPCGSGEHASHHPLAILPLHFHSAWYSFWKFWALLSKSCSYYIATYINSLYFLIVFYNLQTVFTYNNPFNFHTKKTHKKQNTKTLVREKHIYLFPFLSEEMETQESFPNSTKVLKIPRCHEYT